MTFQHRRSTRQARIACSLVALPIVVTLALSTEAPAQEYSMKFATLTLNDMQHEYIKIYKREIEKVTNGRIKVGIFPAGQLGGAPRQTEGIRLGTIEAAIGPAELFVGADPRFQGLAMAGLFKDAEHARRSLEVPSVKQAIFEVAAQRNLVGIYAGVYDMQGFVSKTPIARLADFSGKRIRVLASEGEQAQVRALGSSAVPMSLPEVLPALQQGAIDGVSSVMGVFVAFKYYDAAPYFLDSHLWALIPVALLSKAWHSKLPPDLQKAVIDVGASIGPEVNKWQIERIAADHAAWKEKGGKSVTLSAAEQVDAEKRVSAAIEPVLDKSAPLKEFYGKIKAGAATVN
jgi:TRAP-type C4-dicarboxylate transport system substrate-binding protein